MNTDATYALIMASAMIAGYVIGRWINNSPPMKLWQRCGLMMGAFCGAMIGAKLPYLGGDLDALLSGAVWFQNGKTILAGLAGGYCGVEIAKWCFDIRSRTGDWLAVPVAVSICIGRWGCFHAGCCYGTPTDAPWSVIFPNVDLLARHPTQIYESIFHGLAALLMVMVIKSQYRGLPYLRGHLVKAYIIAYALYRIATEVIRPEPRWFAGVTGYQVGAVMIALVMTGLWWFENTSDLHPAKP